MSIADRCAAVIPCLNEAATISCVVSAASRSLGSVIVVDDGSTDRTSPVAQSTGAVVLRHDSRSGKGTALKTGFNHARKLGFEWAMALDGDGQHSPAEIPAFLSRADQTCARLIVGNRMHAPASMPLVRRFVNRWMSCRLSAFCGAEWPDTQCGFRLIHLESWSKIYFHARQFEIESELLVRFAVAGHGIEFVPIETRYAGERSKIHPIRDTVRWFKWWLEIKRELGSSDLLPSISSPVRALPAK